jgi:hypothetical protein
MVLAPCDVEGLIFACSVPFATFKSNAKVGLCLLAGAVELTSTLLASPPNWLDGLKLEAVSWGPDNLSITIIDETFDLGCKDFELEGPLHLDNFWSL